MLSKIMSATITILPSHFEDFEVGTRFRLGPVSLSEEAIIAFAREHDPQPFHLDEEAARNGPFGGIVASGWHTACLCHSLVVRHLGPQRSLAREQTGPSVSEQPEPKALGDAESGSLGSPGVDELRWLKPVRPGDHLMLEVEVIATNPSRSRPDRGSVRFGYRCTNQDGVVVMTMVAIGMFRRRR